VDLEPDPWRVLTHYERSDRYYGYPFHRTTGLEDTTLQNIEAGAMLLPNGNKVCARQSESLAYATHDPELHRQLNLNADDFERETGLLRGTVICPSARLARKYLRQTHGIHMPVRTVYTHLTRWRHEAGIPLRRWSVRDRFTPSQGLMERRLSV
jgi:hypothetical protein